MPIVVQNLYFVRAGQERQALDTRRAASRVRAGAGRPVGRILVRLDATATGPAFIWECDYPDLAAREADMAWADGSAAFRAVQERMGGLLDRFERVVFQGDDDG